VCALISQEARENELATGWYPRRIDLRRKVIESIGGLDGVFGLGYYENIDYSLGTRIAGLALLVAENAFAYHRSGGTFGRISRRLIARNKQRFLDKHGRDTLLPHVRDGNLAILGRYAEQAEGGSPPTAFRIANRLTEGADK
jgi:hypothetical protein